MYYEFQHLFPLGWLSPTGEFVPCEYWEHTETAWALCNKHQYEVYMDPPDEVLVQNGWIKIGYHLQPREVYFYRDNYRHVSIAQKRFLEPYICQTMVRVELMSIYSIL